MNYMPAFFKIQHHEKIRHATGYGVRNHICGAGGAGGCKSFCYLKAMALKYYLLPCKKLKRKKQI